MAASQTDRNLLFGVIALQLDILDQSQFAEACAVWALDMNRAMADLLEERGWITPEDRQEITRNLERKLKKHRGDVHASLAAAADSSVREVLRSIDQPAIRQTLDALAPAMGHLLTALISPDKAQQTTVRYVLSRVHGEGGLGRVWLARDTDLNRKVALKEVRLDKAIDARFLRRFLKEAQITGQLEHPNIVPVYELARRSEDDQPFYTMRFVEGRTLAQEIDAFHSERAGRPAERLALKRRLLEPFIKICEAIGYAHSRRVVHRDLKPDNVVLGDHGEVIVLDWGLAKVLPESGGPESTLAGDAIEVSADAADDKTQGPAGTPRYMAPEQAATDSDRIDERTDLYGLGAILFEILANRPPGQGANADEVYTNVAAGRIPRVSQVEPTVPAALDAVCAKALALAPEDRYQSAAALADDVRRWMLDEPVSVYRDPLTVRMVRWGRMHRTLVTSAAAVLFVALAAAMLAASQQAAHAHAMGRKNTELTDANRALELERRKAEEREQLAIDAVKRFGDAVSKNSVLKSNPAFESLRKELLKEPLSFFKVLRGQLEASRDSRPHSLDRLASAAFELALLTDEIGNKQDALRAYGDSLAIRQLLARRNPGVAKLQSELATCHFNIGLVHMATGQPGESLVSYGRALEIWERLARQNPSVIEFSRNTASTYGNIGIVQTDTGHPDQALESRRKEMEIKRRLAHENPTVTVFQSDVAKTHHNIAAIQSEIGQQDLALASYAQAIEILERLARENPAALELASNLAFSHNNVGAIQHGVGQVQPALASYRKALEIRERLAKEAPSVTRFQRDLAASYLNVGMIESQFGHADQALESYRRSLEIDERLARENPTVTELRTNLAKVHDSIALLQDATGHPDDALESNARALEVQETLACEHPETPEFAHLLGAILSNMAWIELRRKRYAEARTKLEAAIVWQRKAVSANPRHPRYRQYLAIHLFNLIEAGKGLNDTRLIAEAQRGLDELKASDTRSAALDARLSAVVKGEAANDNAERLALAQRAYDTGRYAIAARLWSEAIERDPELAADRQAQHRYNAARAAALAGCRQSKDDPAPDEAARAKLRGQARTWFESELDIWSKLLQSASVQQRAAIIQSLKHWEDDSDLAGVRDAKAIDALPEPERKAWRALWKNVADALARAQAGKS
jgi:eukaryotic-like serine/threonine-protein kinase